MLCFGSVHSNIKCTIAKEPENAECENMQKEKRGRNAGNAAISQDNYANNLNITLGGFQSRFIKLNPDEV